MSDFLGKHKQEIDFSKVEYKGKVSLVYLTFLVKETFKVGK